VNAGTSKTDAEIASQGSIWHWGCPNLTPTGKIMTLAVNSLQKCSQGHHLSHLVPYYLSIRPQHQKFHTSNPPTSTLCTY